MEQHEISSYALKNIVSDYVDHKRQMEIYEEEADENGEDDIYDTDYWYHCGFADAAKQILISIGISPQSKIIREKYNEVLKREKEESKHASN